MDTNLFIKIICIIIGIGILLKLCYDHIKISESRDTYKDLYMTMYDSYNLIFNEIYETTVENNGNGTVTCKYKIKDNLKELITGLNQEIKICTLDEKDLVED